MVCLGGIQLAASPSTWVAAAMLSWNAVDSATEQVRSADSQTERRNKLRSRKRISAEEKLAAAKARKQKIEQLRRAGMPVAEATRLAAAEAAPDPLTTADYFGFTPNWGYSPLPAGSLGSITVDDGGSGYSATPVVTITDAYGTGAGATATATVTGGVITAITVNNAGAGYTAPIVDIADATGLNAAASAVLTNLAGGMRKFLDDLPRLGPGGVNNLGQFLAVGSPDVVTYPGSDYYEIELVEFTEKMHTDLGPTKLRGYRQFNNGTDTTACGGASQPACDTSHNTVAPPPVAHYLGPILVASKDRPVRIKFVNRLPTGEAGKLFIPVDVSIEGAGLGPDRVNSYPQNRGTLHLHGGKSPWISDGTPHQWIVPFGEPTPYKKGESVEDVPDMPPSQEGEMTFYWTNQQSARLMFYHDHSWGITRLGVYAGGAAGYLIRDAVEEDLIARGIIPADELPLIIQDKTFVDPATIGVTDPTWDHVTPGTPTKGDLWWPHVYMPAQNPFDLSGANPMGRWHYGPYFWPPTSNIQYPPVPNVWYDCGAGQPCTRPWEPPEMPATPNPSWGAEAFLDTPVVNGTAYPKLTVEPKAYRLRILNAAHDRFFNLSLFEADGTVPAGCVGCAANTEVKMVPAVATPGFPASWPADQRDGGVPDPATSGPSWIQIGTEGGFLPKPVVIPPNPVYWNNDVTTFNAGNVAGGSLILGPAERADVIVDFSAFAGKTLILYNDAPAPFPALDPHYDYYTGAPNLLDIGGAPGVYPGFGPNTRTIMQITVSGASAGAFNLTALEAEFATTGTQDGVFKRGQDPIIVGQAPYNSAYNMTFPTAWPYWGVARISDNYIKYMQVDGTYKGDPANPNDKGQYLEPKAIQDEMGETFDMYGRMSAKLGLELAFTNAQVQTFVLQNFVDPPTEILNDGEVQIWKITHNGVDTHPVHFHLFDVQLLNRVGWDGFIRTPDPNELGWKDTVRISPLEDTIVALRPAKPMLPFGIPNSTRPLNPSQPLGSTEGFSNLDPVTGDALVPPTTNQIVDLGWEYVWHCHILSHEEMDMMRVMRFNVLNEIPDAPIGLLATTAGVLTWTDPTPGADPAFWGDPKNEIGFRVERASRGTTNFVPVGTALANATTFTDTTGPGGGAYTYRVFGYNAAGNGVPATVDVTLVGPPGAFVKTAPVNAALQQPLTLTLRWGAAYSAASYEYCVDTTNDNTCAGTWTSVGANTQASASGLSGGVTYFWQVRAVNADGTTAADGGTWFAFTTSALPGAFGKTSPVNAASGLARTVALTWGLASGATSYEYCYDTSNNNTCNATWVSVTGTTANLVNLQLATTYYWQVRARSGAGTTAANGGTWWSFVTQGTVVSDFNADGRTDLVFRNLATGLNNVWYMNGAARLGQGALPTVTDTTWRIVATPDLNRDGRPDLLWRSQTTGENAAWFMDGTTMTSLGRLLAVPIAWTLGATADFNGDGNADLLWRNPTTGENVLWYMNGVTRIGTARLLSVAEANWKIVGAADFDLNGKPDIVFRNTGTGQNVLWYMNGAVRTGYVVLRPVTDTNWHLAVVADFTGNGLPDIVWRHATTGENILWDMNNATYLGYTFMPTLTGNWATGSQQQ